MCRAVHGVKYSRRTLAAHFGDVDGVLEIAQQVVEAELTVLVAPYVYLVVASFAAIFAGHYHVGHHHVVAGRSDRTLRAFVDVARSVGCAGPQTRHRFLKRTGHLCLGGVCHAHVAARRVDAIVSLRYDVVVADQLVVRVKECGEQMVLINIRSHRAGTRPVHYRVAQHAEHVRVGRAGGRQFHKIAYQFHGQLHVVGDAVQLPDAPVGVGAAVHHQGRHYGRLAGHGRYIFATADVMQVGRRRDDEMQPARTRRAVDVADLEIHHLACGVDVDDLHVLWADELQHHACGVEHEQIYFQRV